MTSDDNNKSRDQYGKNQERVHHDEHGKRRHCSNTAGSVWSTRSVTYCWKSRRGFAGIATRARSGNWDTGFFSSPTVGPVPIFEISDSGFNPRFDLSYARIPI